MKIFLGSLFAKFSFSYENNYKQIHKNNISNQILLASFGKQLIVFEMPIYCLEKVHQV